VAIRVCVCCSSYGADYNLVSSGSSCQICHTDLGTYVCLRLAGDPDSVLESNVKAVLGSSKASALGIVALLWSIGVSAPTLVATCNSGGTPLEDELPANGISFLAWKLRGLLPLTMTGAVLFSLKLTLVPSVKVPTTLRCKRKCCWSSRRRPLFAVAMRNCRRRNAMGNMVYSPFGVISAPESSSASSGRGVGSCSPPANTSSEFGGGVFQGITISLTA